MLLARIPQGWLDVGLGAGIITGVLACLTAISKAARAAVRGACRGVSAAVDLSDTAHLVRYHLGPNGSTRPIHERLRQLEIAHRIETDDPKENPCSQP